MATDVACHPTPGTTLDFPLVLFLLPYLTFSAHLSMARHFSGLTSYILRGMFVSLIREGSHVCVLLCMFAGK